MSSAFNAHVQTYDEKGYAKEIDIFLWDSDDKRKAQQVMAATGIPTELDAVIMVFRRYQPDFLKWWSGDKSAAPSPLSNQASQPNLLQEIMQEHESFLADLEAKAVEAILTNNWDGLFLHVASFQRELEASTKDLPRPGADSFSQTELTLDKD